jgi:TM2 domain-containing membrane protein YozV
LPKADEQPKTARSYRGSVVDDNAIVSINLKWLGQLLVLVGMLVYGYWRVETRIATLEDEIVTANEEIEELVKKHIQDEDIKMSEMQEQIKWYETEFNLNPLSWKKKKRK